MSIEICASCTNSVDSDTQDVTYLPNQGPVCGDCLVKHWPKIHGTNPHLRGEKLNNVKDIERVFNVVDRAVFTTTSKLNYDRITAAIICLARLVDDFNGDGDDIWCIGEFSPCGLSDLIIGAYWHYAEWHRGQFSQEYIALSILGQCFTPGMSCVETDNYAYQELEILADNNKSYIKGNL